MAARQTNDLEFVTYDVVQLDFLNNMEEDTEYELEISINYQLNYAEDDKMLVADCVIEIEDEDHKGDFRLSFNSMALFSYMQDNLNDQIREEYHRETVRILTPLWNETLNKFSDLADIPLIELEEPDPDEVEIVFEDGTENLN